MRASFHHLGGFPARCAVPLDLLVAEHAAPLLRELLPKALGRDIDWAKLAAAPTSRVDGDQRDERSDLVFSTTLRGRPALLCLLLEHKSKPDRWTALQVLAYMLTL